MKRARKHRRAAKPQKGSALLVSLMIIVGLSMLGLGFVAISETESAISVNETYGIQTQAAAEAGARMAIEWFQDPTWALGNTAGAPTRNAAPIMPLNVAAVKTTRYLGEDPAAPEYTGVYKASASTVLFDRPYKPNHEDRFYGIEENADVIIDTSTAPAIIDNINVFLFGSATANPRITSIRVYAPPISGGSLYTHGATGTQFWSGGTRYGVATISCTASRFAADGVTASGSRKVRIIVGEFPTPVPAGPLQSAVGNISYSGSSNIHWGWIQAAGTLTDTKNVSSIPWANPYEIVHFERGYDTQVWPIQTGSAYDGRNYLNEVVGRTYGDPWFALRATGDVTNATTAYQFQFVENWNDPRYSNFEFQDAFVYPTKKRIVFPKIEYAFWKKVALQGRGTKGIYYFKYDAATQGFKRNGAGTAHSAAWWVNAIGDANLGGGFYFFDTTDGSNPQGDATPALTPDLNWSSGDVGDPFLMRGFIYFNAGDFRTTGLGNAAPEALYKMPGEPFRDIGYRRIDMATGEWAPSATGAVVDHIGAADGIFSYQDLNGNDRFDVVTRGPFDLKYNDSGNPALAAASYADRPSQYLPKVWHADSEPDPDGAGDCEMLPADWDGTQTGPNYCSEPHEPYLNMIYPAVKTGSVTVKWEANDDQSQRPKGDGFTCVTGGGFDPIQIPDQCTSNAYDEDGGAVELDAGIDGLVYNQGTYSTQGNMDVYGAMLAGGGISGTGNLDFWFKEELKRGNFVPPGAPRVIIYSMQTDDVDDEQ